MICPKDKTEMKQITKDNVLLDFCPSCRGVWLDRGELDKIVDRAIEDYQQKEIKLTEKPETGQHKTNFLGALFDLDEPGVEDIKDRK